MSLPPNLILTIGEVLVDWVCLDRTLSLDEAGTFIKLAGGAPANVAVALARLGSKTGFLGGFSADIFGGWLREILSKEGIDLQWSPTVPGTNTRQAYVLTAPDGNRAFQGFTLSGCADVSLRAEHFPAAAFEQVRTVYWGSVVQSKPAMAQALLNWLAQAPASVLKVYDPNYRDAIWPELPPALSAMRQSFEQAHVVKLSDNEIELLGHPGADYKQTARELLTAYNLSLLVITMGSQGSFYCRAQDEGTIPAFRVTTVETTGAGDGFVAGMIAGLDQALSQDPAKTLPQQKLADMPQDVLVSILTQASAVGALAATRPGAMTSLPTREELAQFLQAQGSSPLISV